MTSQFNNLSNEQLADEYGNIDAIIKEYEERKEALKLAIKARDFTAARGKMFAVTVTETTTERLDTKRLKEDLGDALNGYFTSTTSKTLRVKAAPRIEALAEVA